jgi:hypothetical protein
VIVSTDVIRFVRLGFATVLALATAAIACVGSDPDLTPPTPGSSSGGGGEGGDAGHGANDSGNGPGPNPGPTDNLLKNAQFDTSCDGWTPYGAIVTPNAAGHDGGGSCLVCGQGEKGWVLEQVHDFDHLDRVTFKAEAWVSAPEAGVAAGDMTIDFELWDNQGNQLVSLASSSVEPTPEKWRGIQGTFDIGDAGGDNRQVKFQINCRNMDKCNEGCALVDDAILRQ